MVLDIEEPYLLQYFLITEYGKLSLECAEIQPSVYMFLNGAILCARKKFPLPEFKLSKTY